MKALVYHGPRDIRFEEVPDPNIDSGEVLVKMRAVGICGADFHAYRTKTSRRVPPLIMGHEVTGDVIKVGSDVKEINARDKIAVQPLIFCEKCMPCKEGRRNLCENRQVLGVDIAGAYANYFKVPARVIFRLPQGLSYLEGTLAEPLSVALHALNRSNLNVHEDVLIVGAGTIGLLTLAAAKVSGAEQIFITGTGDYRLKIAKQLGADVTINVNKEDPIKKINDMTNKRGISTVFEAVGTTDSIQQSLSVTKTGGNMVLIGMSEQKIQMNALDIVTKEINLMGTYVSNNEFSKALEILASGEIKTEALISSEEPFDRGVEVFEKMVESRDRLIKVVLTQEAG